MLAIENSSEYESGLAVELAGINLKEKKLIAIWQTYVPLSNIQDHSGFSILETPSIAIDRQKIYLAIKGIGLLQFSGNLKEGRYLEEPRILTKQNGLPSILTTSMEYADNYIWLAYGAEGHESGLGLYDPNAEK